MLEDYLNKEYTKEEIEKIKKGLCKRKTTFRINNLHNNPDVLKELKKNNIEYLNISWFDKAFIVLENEDKIKDTNSYKNGDIYLQSLSSMLPPLILDPKENEQILDMTAAPGSKTSEIAALSNNLSMITAVEKNKKRLERLKYNLDKLGVKKCQVLQNDARYLDDFYSFDKILLDAPCSGSGTLENINDFDEELFIRINIVQKELIDKAIKLLKVNGELVYSTCSILKQENEDVVDYILNKYNDIELINIDKENYKNIDMLSSKYKEIIKICPDKDYEGFFVAKFKKRNVK